MGLAHELSVGYIQYNCPYTRQHRGNSQKSQTKGPPPNRILSSMSEVILTLVTFSCSVNEDKSMIIIVMRIFIHLPQLHRICQSDQYGHAFLFTVYLHIVLYLAPVINPMEQ